MMKPILMSLTATLLVAGLASAEVAQAQGRIYRCGNEYTNSPAPGQKGCKPLSGGNVTVVERTRVTETLRVAAGEKARPPARVRDEQQRARDADARRILEAELMRAETRRDELLREYNNGEPEKLGPETRNHQKYLDRVAELKASLERSESDLAGLRRELGRFPESK